jgi:hypothetical protein
MAKSATPSRSIGSCATATGRALHEGQILSSASETGVCRRLHSKGKAMKHSRLSLFCLGVALCGVAASAAAKSEIKGAAILDHACGKVAVKQMGLVHAGKMDDANKLTTKQMQDQWKAMPAKDRTMMSGMMKEMSQTEDQYAADIRNSGLLMVDGPAATLTVKKQTKDANGSSTSTTTQQFVVDGDQCLVSR